MGEIPSPHSDDTGNINNTYSRITENMTATAANKIAMQTVFQSDIFKLDQTSSKLIQDTQKSFDAILASAKSTRELYEIHYVWAKNLSYVFYLFVIVVGLMNHLTEEKPTEDSAAEG